MAEMKALAAKSRFGDIIEITGYLSFGFYARMHVVYICAWDTSSPPHPHPPTFTFSSQCENMHISAKEYKQEVNQAGEGVWVVLLLYKSE